MAPRNSTSPQYVAAIDQGTSSTRCMLFDGKGNVMASAQKEHTQIYPKAGWVEHDPLEIWQSTVEVVNTAMHGLKVEDVAAVGITNQRETTVVWDKVTGRPLYNAIVWNCSRTDEIAERICAEDHAGKDHLRPLTGLPIVPYFSATKLVWLFENVPGLREAAHEGTALFGTIDTWLVWKLTAGAAHVTDVSNACRTLLMNIHTMEWDDRLLDVFEVPRCMLPMIVPSASTRIGTVHGDALAVLAGVPISGVLGDQQAATFGQVCFGPGQAKSTYGTGAFIMMNTGHKAVPSKNGLLTTIGWQLGEGAEPVYCLEGGVAYAGSLIQWVRDNLGLMRKASESEAIAASVEDNGDIYFVPAFAGLFAPYWRSDARGCICGLTAYNTSAHLVRAALESTAYQVKDVLDAMASDSRVHLHSLKCDGGMTVNNLLMQFQSDILNADVSVPKVTETTALGVAFAAGLAVGFFENLSELEELWTEGRRWVPHMPEAHRRHLTARWRMAVERSFNWHGEAYEHGHLHGDDRQASWAPRLGSRLTMFLAAFCVGALAVSAVRPLGFVRVATH